MVSTKRYEAAKRIVEEFNTLKKRLKEQKITTEIEVPDKVEKAQKDIDEYLVQENQKFSNLIAPYLNKVYLNESRYMCAGRTFDAIHTYIMITDYQINEFIGISHKVNFKQIRIDDNSISISPQTYDFSCFLELINNSENRWRTQYEESKMTAERFNEIVQKASELFL